MAIGAVATEAESGAGNEQEICGCHGRKPEGTSIARTGEGKAPRPRSAFADLRRLAPRWKRERTPPRRLSSPQEPVQPPIIPSAAVVLAIV